MSPRQIIFKCQNKLQLQINNDYQTREDHDYGQITTTEVPRHHHNRTHHNLTFNSGIDYYRTEQPITSTEVPRHHHNRTHHNLTFDSEIDYYPTERPIKLHDFDNCSELWYFLGNTSATPDTSVDDSPPFFLSDSFLKPVKYCIYRVVS